MIKKIQFHHSQPCHVNFRFKNYPKIDLIDTATSQKIKVNKLNSFRDKAHRTLDKAKK
jgi:hypothetical protein